MLPPKRSTRSLCAVSQATEDKPLQMPPTNSDSWEAPCQPPLAWDAQNQFVLSTPQGVLIHQEPQEDSAQKKVRRKLTTPQRLALENLASHGTSPSLEVRRTLAAETGLELKVISVWFQNKRRPSNKIPSIASQKLETGKTDQGNRKVLGDVSSNTFGCDKVVLEKPSDSLSEFPATSLSPDIVQEQCKAPPGIWDLLPSSPHSPTPGACQAETLLLMDSPDPLMKENKRHSLEWACKNDERTVKRARTSRGFQEHECTTPARESVQRPRPRTDKKPRRPSSKVLHSKASTSRSRESRTQSRSFCDCTCTEKDILDVALALIQLKGEGAPRQVRKSI